MRVEGMGESLLGSLGERLLSGTIKPQFVTTPPWGFLIMGSIPGQKLTPIRGLEGWVFDPTPAHSSRVSSRYGDGQESSWEHCVDNKSRPGSLPVAAQSPLLLLFPSDGPSAEGLPTLGLSLITFMSPP